MQSLEAENGVYADKFGKRSAEYKIAVNMHGTVTKKFLGGYRIGQPVDEDDFPPRTHALASRAGSVFVSWCLRPVVCELPSFLACRK